MNKHGWIVAMLGGLSACPLLASKVQPDIEYGRAGGERLLLDASVPDGPGPFPVAILVHGGGWRHGDKAGSDHPGNPADISPWFAPLTEAKFTWFSINYRMIPQYRWPACLEDVQTAIRWVKGHAGQFKGDPARIALFGHSAGGHLAAMAGTHSTRDTRVQALVLFAPAIEFPAELLPYVGRSDRLQVVDRASRRWKTELDALSEDGLIPQFQDLSQRPANVGPETLAILRNPWPMDQVTHFMPPVLLVHGDSDRTVPYRWSNEFEARLRAAGVPCELITIPGGPHSIVDGTKIDPSYRPKMIAWLRRTLQPSKQESDDRSDITVAADGSGNFKTVQEALDSVPRGNRKRRIVFVKEGVYREKIRMDSAAVTLRGESRRSTWIEFAPAQNDAVATISADECRLENLSIENTRPPAGGRAAAIVSLGDRTIVADCDVLSEGGETIALTHPAGRSYLARLVVRGALEAVSSEGWCRLDDSEIYQVSSNAAATFEHAVESGDGRKFVIRNCRLDGAAGWHLLRHDGDLSSQYFLLDCRFSNSMGGEAPYWDGKAYFYSSRHAGGNFSWHADNLASAPGSPSPESVTPSWTFGGSWDPTGR